MSKVYIVEAKRSPIGSFLGSLSSVPPSELAGHVMKQMIEETSLNLSDIDEVILGNVISAGQGQGVARQAAIFAGIPNTVPAYSINMICGSGMKTVMMAYSQIKAGFSHVILAGGVEVMSQIPYATEKNVRTGSKMGGMKLNDLLITDGLTDAFNQYHMGVTAENIVEKHNITRKEQDEYAYDSQQKAIVAIDSERFKDEIVSIDVKNRKEVIKIATDEYPNRKSNIEKLSSLKAVFKKDGTVTAGNSSGINDGASVLLLMSEEAVIKYKMNPIAEVIEVGQAGIDPSIMGLGPVPAIKNVLEKSNLSLNELDLIELNEAFAAQALGVMKELEINYDVTREWIYERTNVNGGAIALGHPLGASGARILTTLVHEMRKRKSTYGLASLCIGGGMGTAIIVKSTQSK